MKELILQIRRLTLTDTVRRLEWYSSSFNLFPHKTVKENIMLAPVELKLMTKEEASKKADELLARVGLPDKAECISGYAFGRTETAYCHCTFSCHESGCDAF